jgi:NAD(P)-dependent dehydrogenase (short-subunit alcohol dehydrogenase family)
LGGKVAVVSGAGGGIGRAHALLLATEGAKVVVNDLTNAQAVVDEINDAGGTATANGADVATFDGAEALVAQAIDDYGQLDILVNNAGILRDAVSFKMTEDEFDSVVNVHLKGHFAPSKFAGQHWRQRSKAGDEVSGRIINTASEAGLYGNAGQANYAAAKAGIASMTIVLARELKKYGVTVNTIAPRALTQMTAPLLEGFHNPQKGEFDPWDPHNIAPVVGWLATDDSAHINGQTFVIFGNKLYLMEGWTMASKIESPGRFDIDELIKRSEELFGDRSTKIPPMGFGE